MKIKLFKKGRLCGLIGNESRFYHKVVKNEGCIFKECGLKKLI